MYGKTLFTKGALVVDGHDVGILDEEGVGWSPEVEVLEILDTSTMPMTVLERRPTLVGGTLSASMVEISSANASLISKIFSQDTVTVSFTASRAGGGGSVTISMSATVSAASVRFRGSDWAVAEVTFKSLGAPTITGMS